VKGIIMKNGLPIILTALALAASAAQAQTNFTVDWFTIDGGGGVSTGGTYTVNGTIGQPDAGAMSGGPYSVTGGFWAMIGAVQTPGLPNLFIRSAGPNSVVVSWASTPASTLATNASLNTTNWVTYGGTVSTSDGTNNVTITPAAGRLFFRLKP
jgi:hypothetical protein